MPAPPGARRRTQLVPYNWRPAPGGPAVDAGLRLPGINDGFQGAAPDIGAVESGDPIAVFGPGSADGGNAPRMPREPRTP